jgi:hypothetical protein
MWKVFIEFVGENDLTFIPGNYLFKTRSHAAMGTDNTRGFPLLSSAIQYTLSEDFVEYLDSKHPMKEIKSLCIKFVDIGD